MQARNLILTAAVLLVSATHAAAQTPPPGAPKPPPPDPKLSFEREVFNYPAEGRRDPFRPLGGQDALGPLFEDLSLRGIMFVPSAPANSIAIISDGARKIYRLRRGETIGNARVAAVERYQVRFLVENYGILREEVMPLAQRQSVLEARSQQTEANRQELSELFAEELLRALRGRRDSAQAVEQQQQTRPQTPQRRDTTQTTARPRGN